MKNIVRKLADFGIGFYLTIPSIIFIVLSCVMYTKTGVTDFKAELDMPVIISLIISAIIAFVSMVLEVIPCKYTKIAVKPVRYVSFLLALYAFIGYVGSQATYITNVFVAIDGNSFTPGFITTAVFFVLSLILTLVSSSLNGLKPWADKEDRSVSIVIEETK